MILEVEERAARVHSHTNQFTHQSTEVTNPNPKTLYNARGTSYKEGDPNMGYSPKSLQPRYSQSRVTAVSNLSSTHPVDLVSIRANSDRGIPTSPPRQPIGKPHSQHLPPQTNLNPSGGQCHQKPKPKNSASLLQSQSPSLDMKLAFPTVFES